MLPEKVANVLDKIGVMAQGSWDGVADAGAYAWLGEWLYGEVGAYTGLSAATQRALGVDPAGEAEIDGAAPYWRVALTGRWGASSITSGTSGMYAATRPERTAGAGHDQMSNLKLSLQYTMYGRFNGASKNYDGSGRDAADNDTLFLEAWWML